MNEEIKPKKNKRITIEVTPNQHTEIKLAAASRGMTIREFIENALINYGKILNSRNNFYEN